ncbi:21627_t:CDS:2, partial [Cetraspora pellucida]
ISKLQKLRKEQLSKLIKKQYNELDNVINTSKGKLENNQLKKIEKLKPIKKPKSISFDELKEQIKNIDLSNAEKLLDDNDLHQNIINSNLLSNDINDLENLRNEKIKTLINKQYNHFEDSINLLESEEDLESLKNQIKQKKKKGYKKNNRKYDTIKKNIDKFLTPETLDKFIIKNIDFLNKKYLTDGRSKNKLNEIHKEKRKSLIHQFKKEENKKYNFLIEDIKNCDDSYLLSDEYYNKIYHNIKDLNKAYLSKDNTKSNLYQIREKRKMN